MDNTRDGSHSILWRDGRTGREGAASDGGTDTGTTSSVGVSVAYSTQPNSRDQTFLTRLRIVKINYNYNAILPISGVTAGWNPHLLRV